MTDLPPRVRGAPGPGASRLVRSRLTPACAGSTSISAVISTGAPTYPRVCGEHHRFRSEKIPTYDLPPRVRGARLAIRSIGDAFRLTPACAGSTTTTRPAAMNTSTYPRVCGEHHTPGEGEPDDVDLPPRVRGARCAIAGLRVPERLTPACAGSTLLQPHVAHLVSTYPRVCGEHPSQPTLPIRSVDLPPRVRGAQTTRTNDQDSPRLTPACAGSTQLPESGWRLQTTYPRVCGEHAAIPAVVRFVSDLPPRVRGARVERGGEPLCHRLTPACAGSTGQQPVRSG